MFLFFVFLYFCVCFAKCQQKYKAFVAQVDAYQKALKKKGAAAASDVYPQVEAALNIWLEEIELPSSGEL